MGAIIGDFVGIPQCRQKGQPQMTQQTFQHYNKFDDKGDL
jgi:hypothetical protein